MALLCLLFFWKYFLLCYGWNCCMKEFVQNIFSLKGKSDLRPVLLLFLMLCVFLGLAFGQAKWHQCENEAKSVYQGHYTTHISAVLTEFLRSVVLIYIYVDNIDEGCSISEVPCSSDQCQQLTHLQHSIINQALCSDLSNLIRWHSWY